MILVEYYKTRDVENAPYTYIASEKEIAGE